MHRIVGYMFLNIYKKIHTSFCQVLKEMHTKENWFFFLPQRMSLLSGCRLCKCGYICMPEWRLSRPARCVGIPGNKAVIMVMPLNSLYKINK